MEQSNRVLVIGLDGATWDVLDPWIRDGTLPNLGRLRQSGSWGSLKSSIPPITAAAWSTFMTGKRPGKHGVFHFIDLFDDRDTADVGSEIVDARNLKSSTLWDIAGHWDRQVVLINIPMTYPPRPVNGVMITGLLTPRSASIFTYPPELSQETTDYQIDLDRFMDHKPFQNDGRSSGIGPSQSLVNEFEQMLEKRARLGLAWLASRPWDLFMIVFTGTDRMGHYLWPYHRQPHGEDTPEVKRLCAAVHRYYVRLDEIVGELVERAGKDATVFIMSDHGMGPPPPKLFRCNNWLQEHGWLAARSAASGITSPDGWLKRLGIPRDKLAAVLRRIPSLARSELITKAAHSRTSDVNKQHSKAYCLPIFFNIMGIRINLEGEEREALRREIMQGLKRVIDPETGQRVVRRVCRGEDYYHGPYAHNAPDIIAILDPDYGCSHHLGPYSHSITKRLITGGPAKHRAEGIFMASGPRIAVNPEALPNLHIEDVAPTVLHSMDLPVPEDLDGRTLIEILDPVFLGVHPVRKGEPVGFWPDGERPAFSDKALSEEDEAQIRERLQALGYFE